MRLDNPINIAELAPATGDYSPVEEGWYPAIIRSVEIHTTKAGNGRYAKFRFDITGQKAAGRVIFSNLNIQNPNAQAEEIGRRQIGAIGRAIGLVDVIRDTDQLVNGSLEIYVTIRKSEQYGDQNEVTKFRAVNRVDLPKPAEQFAPQPVAKPTQEAAPLSSAVPPWAK